MKIERVIISGGGSGGHIFPAIAIADELKRRNESVQILFVGAEGKMEMEKVPERGPLSDGYQDSFSRLSTDPAQNKAIYYEHPVKYTKGWTVI